MIDKISYSASKVAAAIPPTEVLVLLKVTKSPVVAPWPVSEIVTLALVLVVVKALTKLAVSLIGVISWLSPEA